MWWVMAESCLPCLCSSCACSTRYHFVPPLPRHLQQAVLHQLRSAQCSLLTGLPLPGKPSPTETSRDSTGWGRRDGRKGRRCGFGPVRSPGCTRPLALPQHTAPSVTHRKTKRTKQQYIYTHRKTHMHAPKHTSRSARKKWTESKREKRIPNFRVIIWISVRVINWSNLCAISSDSMYGSWFHYTVTLITFLPS